MRDRAFYHYAIEGFETNKNNDAVVDILYGNGKTPLHIFKKDAETFLEAITTPRERRETGIERIKEGNEVETLNHFLKGRVMILLTDFENYLEYCNGAQSGVKEIAGLRINGKIAFADAFDYEALEPSIEDLYPKK